MLTKSNVKTLYGTITNTGTEVESLCPQDFTRDDVYDQVNTPLSVSCPQWHDNLKLRVEVFRPMLASLFNSIELGKPDNDWGDVICKCGLGSSFPYRYVSQEFLQEEPQFSVVFLIEKLKIIRRVNLVRKSNQSAVLTFNETESSKLFIPSYTYVVVDSFKSACAISYQLGMNNSAEFFMKKIIEVHRLYS